MLLTAMLSILISGCLVATFFILKVANPDIKMAIVIFLFVISVYFYKYHR